MKQPKLSICIPTYNRAAFLERLLQHFVEDISFPFGYEIIISDNASVDSTPEVAGRYATSGLPITYFRQESTVLSFSNSFHAMRRARGQYLLNLADDDLLIPDAVTAVVGMLDLNLEIAACFAPHELYDDVAGECIENSFKNDSDKVIQAKDFMGLFEFIVIHQALPEIGIYRAEAIWPIMFPKDFCLYNISHLAHILDYGAIALTTRPFYRFVVRPRVQLARQQVGNVMTLTDWDTFRGGLEYFLYIGFVRNGTTLDDAQKLALTRLLDAYVLQRMMAALNLWVKVGKHLQAYELYCRISVTLRRLPGMPSYHKALATIKPDPSGAMAQAVVEMVGASTIVSRLVLFGFADMDAWEERIRGAGLPTDVELVPCTSLECISSGASEVTFVFAADEQLRQAAIDLGYAPGLVVARVTLAKSFLIPESSQ